MKVQIVERKVNLREETKAYLQEKITKFSKVFEEDSTATATFYTQRNRIYLEVTIRSGDMIVRAECDDTEARSAIDKAVEIIDGQMRKYKTKLSKRLKEVYVPEFEEYEFEEEPEFEIVKTKQIFVKPMPPEEAILQMKLLNHSFFVFQNSETERHCVVYCRKDGKYGLIEIE